MASAPQPQLTVKMSKQALRSTLKKTLAALPPLAIAAQLALVARHVAALPEYAAARRIALYMSMDAEAQTAPVIHQAFADGKRVFLPRCEPAAAPGRKRNHLRMLEVPLEAAVLQLQPQGKYQLREPLSGAEGLDEGLDLIVVPGVAFLAAKARLGHGAGFYDEFFLVYQARHGRLPFLVGVGLEPQLVDNVPTEAHDVPLDAVIVGDAVFR